jgi:hypothetical protein
VVQIHPPQPTSPISKTSKASELFELRAELRFMMF